MGGAGHHHARQFHGTLTQDRVRRGVTVGRGGQHLGRERRDPVDRPRVVMEPDVHVCQVAEAGPGGGHQRGARTPSLNGAQDRLDRPGADPERAALVPQQHAVPADDLRRPAGRQREAGHTGARDHAHARPARERTRVRRDRIVREPDLRGARHGGHQGAQAIRIVIGRRGG